MIPCWKSRAGLWIRGGETEITALNQDGSPIACRISRGRRPDVVERCSLDESYKNQEIGFRISASLDEISGKKILLKFTGSSVEKIYEIDVQKLRKEQKPKGFFNRLSEPSGKHSGRL